MPDLLTTDQVTALFTFLGIDRVPSGDSAIVIGTAAVGVPANLRKWAVVIELVVAALARMAYRGAIEVRGIGFG